MSKAAIVTLYNNINIGNKLQNYAVQELLRSYYDEVETLVYREEEKRIIEYRLKSKIQIITGFPPEKAKQKRMLIARRKRFEAFSDKYIKTAPPIFYEKLSPDFGGKYDCFFTGSDQVWHNWSNTEKELDYFFLQFAPESKRMSISASFGFDEPDEKFTEAYRRGLVGMNFISCREKSGVELIERLTSRRAELLIDPTMMLTTEKWDSISSRPDKRVPGKYVLVYILGKALPEDLERINQIAAGCGAEIVRIYDMATPEYYDTTPDEFLYLIRNAAAVCTNSFHGCAFSLLYNKPLYTFVRGDNDGSRMSSRQQTLYDTFGLTVREDHFCVADPAVVGANLDVQRQKFKDYLDCVCKQD